MGKIMYRGEQFPGGPNVLSELRDINFSNVQNKQIILYDSTSRTWKNHAITAADVAYDANNSVEDAIDTLNSAFPKRSGVTAHNIANGATAAFTPYTVPQTCLGYFQIQSNGSAASSIRVNGMAFLRNLLASPISVMFTLQQGDVIDIAGTAANAYIDLYY